MLWMNGFFYFLLLNCILCCITNIYIYLSRLTQCQQYLRPNVFQVFEIWPGPKRRFYDITNVLEGIGVISKLSQSVIKWEWVKNLNSKVINQTISHQCNACILSQKGLLPRSTWPGIVRQNNKVPFWTEGPGAVRKSVGPADILGWAEHQQHKGGLQSISFFKTRNCVFLLPFCFHFFQSHFFFYTRLYFWKSTQCVEWAGVWCIDDMLNGEGSFQFSTLDLSFYTLFCPNFWRWHFAP